MANEPSLETLREILVQKPGIFPVTQAQLSAKELETLLPGESERTNTNYHIDPLKISILRKNIVQFQKEKLPGNKRITHLAFMYGLEKAGSDRHNIKLIMFGVNLDHSPTANLKVKLKTDQISMGQFSNDDLLASALPDRKMKHDKMRKLFVKTFLPFYDNRIVHGAYIRIDDLFVAGQKAGNFSDMLDKIEQEEHCDELEISFGFMKAISSDDWNCFHLIFRGKNTTNNTLSRRIFSTYEFTPGPDYTGPKPGCPPFSCNLSGVKIIGRISKSAK